MTKIASPVAEETQSVVPDSFVMTHLDVELRQCEFRLVRYADTGSTEPKRLLISAAFSGRLQLQLRQSSWGASVTLRSFNVRESIAPPPGHQDTSTTSQTTIDKLSHELIAGNWVRGRQEMKAEDYVAKCTIESHAPTFQSARGTADKDGATDLSETLVERLSIDVDCVAIKILVNWPCIRALINFFAVERAPLPNALPECDDASLEDTEEVERSKEQQQREQKVATPRRVVDLTFKMASPVIVLPQDHADANSAALVLELGDVQFRRAVKVPAALVLDSAASKGLVQ